MKTGAIRILTVSWICGVVSIIYELVWARYLGLILGNSVYAVGVVTGCYMTGMALGDFMIGRWTKKQPERAMRMVLFGLALMCLLSPVIYRGLSAANGMWAQAAWPVWGKMLWRAAISFLALLLPTFLLGGVLPALTARGGCSGGAVYTANTLGAVAGAVLTGFFLIRYLGLGGSALTGAVLAGAALALAGRGGQGKADAGVQSKKETLPAGLKTWVLAAYAVSGMTGMAFQVYQTRILTLFFMDSVYDFAVILAVYLLGLWGGNLLASWCAKRTDQHLKLFAVSQILLGVSTMLSLRVVAGLPFWTDGFQSQHAMFQRFGQNYFLMGILMKAGCTALTLLIPGILWGMAYPLVSRLCVDGSTDAGWEAGVALGWNTVGSACGSLAASFLLVPALGVQKAILFNGCLNLAVGAALAVRGGRVGREDRARRRDRGLWTVLAVGAAFAFLTVPKWDHFEMSTSFLKPGQDVEGYADIRFYREDAYGITSVVDFLPSGQTYLTTNRLYCQNTSDMNGPEDHRRLGYIPLMLHPGPKRVLVEGLGAGVTLRGVQEYGGLEIDCVEISGAVAEAARCFEEENGGVLDSPDISLVIDDARNYLLTSKKAYDVIVADIFFPMSSGSGNMFSREYYEACRRALTQGGIMVQWIPVHQFSKTELEITMKTFSQVFPNATVWFGMLGESVPVAGLVGTEEPLDISFQRLEALYGGGAGRMNLKDTALDDPYMFLSHFVCKIRPEYFAEDLPCNTDERPVLEYLNPTDAQAYWERGRENLKLLLEMKTSASAHVEFEDARQREILEDYDRQIVEFIEGFAGQ